MKICIKDSKVFKDSIIGYWNQALLSVYQAKDHMIQFKWVALSNHSRDFQEIQGFLKFSVQLAHSKDKQTTLEKEEGKAGGMVV